MGRPPPGSIWRPNSPWSGRCTDCSPLQATAPTEYWSVSPRCPRTAVNSQRPPPAATCEH